MCKLCLEAAQRVKVKEKSFENVEKFRYLRTTLTNENSIYEESNSRLKSENAFYLSVQNLLSSRLVPKNIKIQIHRNVIFPVVLYR